MSHVAPDLGLSSIRSIRIDIRGYTKGDELARSASDFRENGDWDAKSRLTPLSPLWKKTCINLARMPCLKHVKLWFYTPTIRQEAVNLMHRRWLEPTKRIRAARLELHTRRRITATLLEELGLILLEPDKKWDFGGSPPEGFVYIRASETALQA